MKTFNLILIIPIVLAAMVCRAQEEVEVTVSPKEMSKGIQTAITVFVPEADVKLVENQWKKFINERSFFEFAGKGTAQTIEKALIGISNIFSPEKKTFEKNSLKVEKEGEELVVKNVIHEQVTQNHVDVYARITGAGNGVFLSSFFRYADSVFIDATNVNEDVMLSLQNYIREFGLETYRKVIEEQIFNQQKEFRKQEAELRSLENKNKNLYNSVGKFEAEIDECNNGIRLLENELKSMEEDLSAAKLALRRTSKDSPDYEQVKENQETQKKIYKKIEKDIKSNKKKVTRNQTRIKRTKADILINERDQVQQRLIVEQEELKVDELEIKLSNIK